MKEKDDLFDLIKSLKKTEKRYFKLFSKQHGGAQDSNYITLFDAMDKLESYDDSKLLKSLKGHPLTKHLSSEKNYLYNLVIKCLNNYYAQSSVEKEVDELISGLQILFNRGLYKQSYKMLKKALSLSTKHELFHKIVRITEIQITLLNHIVTSSAGLNETYNSVVETNQEAVNALQNLHTYQQLYLETIKEFRYKGEYPTEQQKQKLQDLLHHPVLSNIKNANSKKAQNLHYFLNASLRYALGENEKAIVLQKEQIAILEQTDRDEVMGFSAYSACLSNLCEYSIRQKDFKEAERCLHKLKQLEPQHFIESGRVFYRYWDNNNRLAVLKKEYDQVASAAEEILNGLDEYHETIPVSRKLSILYYLSYSHFASGDYKKALKIINLALMEKTDLRQDLQVFIRILNCILHFELGNFLMMESLSRSSHYYFKKTDSLYAFENLFISLYKDLAKTKKSDKWNEIFSHFESQYQELPSADKSRVEEYFNINDWFQTKTKKSFKNNGKSLVY